MESYMENDVRSESQVSRYTSKGLRSLTIEASSEPDMPSASERSKTEQCRENSRPQCRRSSPVARGAGDGD